MSLSEVGQGSIDLDEAARQLEQAAHDAQVAYDCISLGDLDWAHTNAITARAEADAAENGVRASGSRSKTRCPGPVARDLAGKSCASMKLMASSGPGRSRPRDKRWPPAAPR